MLTYAEALKLKRDDRIVVERSGDTGRVHDIEPINDEGEEPRVLVCVQLDCGVGLCVFNNFQIDHEEG